MQERENRKDNFMTKTVINTYLLWKNSENHIQRTLYQLENLMKLEDFQFQFFMYGNDHADLTNEILEQWKASHPEVLIVNQYEELGAPSFGSVQSTIRTSLIAHYRNKCKRMGLNYDSRASLVIDTDIEWTSDDFLSLYNNLVILPLCVGVISSTIQSNIPDWTENIDPFSQYDLFPFRDKLGNPGCYFSRTPFYLEEDRQKFLAGEPVEIASGFGSMALYDSKTYNDCQYSGSFNSEHIALSYQIRQFGKLYVDPKAVPSTTIDLSSVNLDACRQIGADNFKRMKEVNRLHNWALAEKYEFEFRAKNA
jgi:hypothetical protein